MSATNSRHLTASMERAAVLESLTRKSTYSFSVRPSIQVMVSTGQVVPFTLIAWSSQVAPSTYGARLWSDR